MEVLLERRFASIEREWSPYVIAAFSLMARHLKLVGNAFERKSGRIGSSQFAR